jgi:rhodanese-related sulfurtransferase
MSKTFLFLLLFTTLTCAKVYKQFTADEIEKLINDKSVYLVDTRNPPKIIKKGIIPNSIVISLREKYNSTLRSLINSNDKIILLTDKKKFNLTLSYTEKLGFTNVLGYFMIKDWKKPFNQISKIKLTRKKLKQITHQYELIDVREKGKQQKKGNVKKSVNIPLSEFKANINKIDRNKINYFMSGKGFKSMTAVSYLLREGYDINKLSYVVGGYKKAREKIMRKKKRQDL